MTFEIDNKAMQPHKYSGSIVTKKIKLLELLEDEKLIFRSNISDKNKWFAFGRISLIMETLEDDDKNIIITDPLDIYQVYPNALVYFLMNIEQVDKV